MHLRRLVVKGFKSFADRTVIDLSPGISVVVGPNGSGKSNVVDAIAWVLGERGPRALRGGSMEDVIFQGSPNRQALGRAEVELTIDNNDGALAIDLAEVTIRRTLFRTGESEYAINGEACRLLDITELLSDSGIGRELHTLVGQGHIDDILAGSPADRRAVIEDAAGLLKHRKRKEKALRKLERVDADLERLGDLVSELKRQIRPLERQAELAKRADSLQAELTEARLRLWVLDHRAVMQEDDATAVANALADVERLGREVEQLDGETQRTEAELELARNDAESLMSVELRLRSMLDRFRNLAVLASERAQRLADRAARAPSEDVPSPEAIADALRVAQAAEQARSEADRIHMELMEARDAARDERDRMSRAVEELRRLEAERDARRATIGRISDELAGIEETVQACRTDAGVADRESAQTTQRLAALETREIELAANSDRIDGAVEAARAAVSEMETQERAAERALAATEARREVLAQELERLKDPVEFVRSLSGIGGRVLESLEVEPGFEAAVLAALGALTEAVLVESVADAAAAVEAWKEAGVRGVLVVADSLPSSAALPQGSVADHVRARSQDGVKLAAHLSTVALVEDLSEAEGFLNEDPSRIIVTRRGDRVDRGLVSGGAEVAARDLRGEMAAIEKELAAARASRDALSAQLAELRAQAAAAEADQAVAEEQLNALDAERESLQAQLDRSGRASEAAAAEQARCAARREELNARIAVEESRLREIAEALDGAVIAEPAQDRLVELEAQVADAARALGELSERERAAIAAHRSLVARTERIQHEKQVYEKGRESWERGAARCESVAAEARAVSDRIGLWVEQASEARAGGDQRRTALIEKLSTSRARLRELNSALESARERGHVAELREADRRHRLQALEEQCREKLGMEPSIALEAVDPSPEERDQLETTVRGLERKLSLLGRVNPIAMEQHEELVERHRFLSEQVEDLRTSRRELLGVVSEVDKTITEIFAAAFNDIAREFEGVFERLFPGGEGRLSLVDPEDLLETGVEVEARPAGKRVKRVSLLSGGERSLVALALLFAVFKARPSPFYILDEVEAALDDVNLDRVLKVLTDFRDRSQLLIVTHQKRTMEIADVIYGIAMAEAGVTRVLSERLDRVVEPV